MKSRSILSNLKILLYSVLVFSVFFTGILLFLNQRISKYSEQLLDIQDGKCVLQNVVSCSNGIVDSNQSAISSYLSNLNTLNILVIKIQKENDNFSYLQDLFLDNSSKKAFIEATNYAGFSISQLHKNYENSKASQSRNTQIQTENNYNSQAFINSFEEIFQIKLQFQTTIQRLFYSVLVVGILIILILLFLLSFLVQFKIVARLSNFMQVNNLNSNNITEKDEVKSVIEYINSTKRKVVDFVSRIGGGDFEAEYSQGNDSDSLSIAMKKMKDELIFAENIKKSQKEEEQKLIWIANGKAKLVEILNSYNGHLEDFTSDVIQFVVKYLDLSIGAFYIIEKEEKQVLRLMSDFGGSLSKKKQNEVSIEDGLLGQAVKDQEMIVIKNAPDEYFTIESGLGKSHAGVLILVPLIQEEITYGVIEVAGFKEVDLFKIDFLKNISADIANMFARLQTNIHTENLLLDSQQKSSLLAQNEEEMRRNLIEMEIIQEELKRKEIELQTSKSLIEFELEKAKWEINNQFREIEKAKIRTEKTLEGMLDAVFSYTANDGITFFNNAAETLWGYTKDEVMGKNVSLLFNQNSIEESPFLKGLTLQTKDDFVGFRSESNILNKNEELVSVLLLTSEAKVDNESYYTVFVQTIELEFF